MLENKAETIAQNMSKKVSIAGKITGTANQVKNPTITLKRLKKRTKK